MKEMTTFIEKLPQIVPESWCAQCKICCRFPDTENVQTPAWSPLEAKWAGRDPSAFSWFETDRHSPSLSPKLEPCGEGLRCPAFHSETNRCSIYPVRPLDCRLYPFTLTKDTDTHEVILAMDTKCPYIQAHGNDPDVSAYAKDLARYLENPLAAQYLQMNPKIVGASWPEFVTVATLSDLASQETKSTPPHPLLSPLRLEDVSMVQEALRASQHEGSCYTAAGLLGWSDLLSLWWTRKEGALCIFAEQSGGYFMPLPPLGEILTPRLLEECWELLQGLNQGSGVSRIQGIEPKDLSLFERCGFELKTDKPEYLYQLRDLAALRGDRYRTQRWLVNRARKKISYQIRPFEPRDLVPCLQLYTKWGLLQQRKTSDFFPKALIRDGLFFHRRLMMSFQELGLTGRVCEVDGRIQGYTFGGPISKDLFCVFVEIVDRSHPGMAQLLFWEFCKEVGSQALILNAMGDEGLSGLRRNKQAYRPMGLYSTATAVKKKT